MIESSAAMKNGMIFGKCFTFYNDNIKIDQALPTSHTIWSFLSCKFPHFPLTRSLNFLSIGNKSQLAFKDMEKQPRFIAQAVHSRAIQRGFGAEVP